MRTIVKITCLVILPIMLIVSPHTTVADSVKLTNGLTYEPVKIKNVTDGIICYRMATGAIVTKPLTQVARVTITRDKDLTQAEKLLVEGKYAQAEKFYLKSLKKAVAPWKKNLIEYRLLVINQLTGKIDKAVEIWLKIVDASNASIGTLALCPKKLAPAKSPANDQAIDILEKKLKTVTSKPYSQAILKLLVNLYERQGNLEKARQAATRLLGKQHTQSTTATSGETSQPQQPIRQHSYEPQLRLARISLRAGRYNEVVSQLEPLLSKLSDKELPEGLYLIGRAKLELSKRTTDKDKAKKLLLEAGIKFMEVVSYFPQHSRAPWALLLAGKVNQRLGNITAARKAYLTVIKQYNKSEAAKLAKKAINLLTKTHSHSNSG